MRATLAIALVILVASAAPTFAAEEHPKPSDETVWKLSRFLTGTSEQIRDKLNRECERFMARRKMMQQKISDLDRRIADEERDCVQRVKNSTEYARLLADHKKAQAALDSLKEGSSPYVRLEAAGVANTARLALQKLEKDAAGQSELLKKLKAERAIGSQALARYETALKESLQWRAELIDATRNAFLLPGPVQIGSEGILGRVIPVKILSGNSFLIEYDAHEDISRGDTKEGITTVKVLTRTILMVVEDTDTTGLKPKTAVLLDRNFRIRDVKFIEGEAVHFASRKPADIDQLFELILPLRDLPLDDSLDAPTTRPTTAPASR
jgi:hypothetical protein